MKPWHWVLILTVLTIAAVVVVTSYVIRALTEPDPLGSWIIAAGWTVLFAVTFARALRQMRMRRKR